MKVVAYSINPLAKEYLAKANQKRHDITLISNPLSVATVSYAAGKDAVIVSTTDDVSGAVIEKLAALNIKFIITQSKNTNYLDKSTALHNGIKLASVLSDEPEEMARQTIASLNLYQQNKCVGNACVCADSCRLALVAAKK